MILFVDTSVWSLAFRRDAGPDRPETARLRSAIGDPSRDTILTTGIVLQELLQGFAGPRQRAALLGVLSAVPLLVPGRPSHVRAAELRNRCRRAGVQLGTIDALTAQLCVEHAVMLLTTDMDFTHASRHCPLMVWRPGH